VTREFTAAAAAISAAADADTVAAGVAAAAFVADLNSGHVGNECCCNSELLPMHMIAASKN
jgi:hypothetical protein